MLTSDAENLALQALAWAAETGELPNFLAISGLSATELRARAADPELLAGFLDFVLANESVARAFCETEKIDPQVLHACRRALPGALPED